MHCVRYKGCYAGPCGPRALYESVVFGCMALWNCVAVTLSPVMFMALYKVKSFGH